MKIRAEIKEMENRSKIKPKVGPLKRSTDQQTHSKTDKRARKRNEDYKLPILGMKGSP